jgi:chromosome partitioning protein
MLQIGVFGVDGEVLLNRRNNIRSMAMAKAICLFNHKGGVSKTTTTFNLGWSMAEKGKKVVIVDLDPQCNLTGLVLGFNAVDEEHMDAFYLNRENLTLQPMIAALIAGATPENFLQTNDGKPLRTKNEKLFLLPGHLTLSDLDSQINVALKIASGVPIMRNVPGGLPKLLRLIADGIGADYLLYDLSPNVGALNEVMLMSSDYFIVPTSPDYFCLQAVNSLEKNITKWHAEIEQFKSMHGFDSTHGLDRLFPIRNSPQFLGVIQQKYRPRNERPSLSFQSWIDKIRQSINQRLVPALQGIGCVMGRERVERILAGTNLQPYDLAHIADFNSLIAISQNVSKPIFALTDSEIKEHGNVFGHAEATMTASRDKFNETFDDLGQRILALVG